MPGLIDTELGATKEKDLLAQGKTLEATTTGFDPERRGVGNLETVSGQLDKVLSGDSPLVTRARAKAAEVANARGLVNSSMAVQAGETAAIDAALPIATADAGTYNLAARENMGAANTALQFTAGAANDTSRTNAAARNQFQQIKAQEEAQKGVIGAQATAASGLQAEKARQEQALVQLRGEVETGLQTLKGGQSVQLAQIEAGYKQLMQANASAASLFNESVQQIATILRDPATSAEQKESAVAAVNASLASSLAVAGAIANIDLGGLLDFTEANPVPK